MILKLINERGETQYKSGEELTLPRNFIKAYIMDDNGKTIETVSGNAVMVPLKQNNEISELDIVCSIEDGKLDYDYEEHFGGMNRMLECYDPLDLLEYALNHCDGGDIFEMLGDIGVRFDIIDKKQY